MEDDINIKIEISLEPLVGSSPNFKLKRMWLKQARQIEQESGTLIQLMSTG